MGIRIDDCETLLRARGMAQSRGLDPNRVVCPSCENGTDCRLTTEGRSPQLPEDYVQNIQLKAAEGQANVDRFYKKIERHFEVTTDRSSATH